MRVRSSGIILPSAGFVCLLPEMLCGLSATQNRSCNPIYGLKPEEHGGEPCARVRVFRGQAPAGRKGLFGDDAELSEKVKTLQESNPPTSSVG